MPAFHSEILESFFDTINNKSEILVRIMESKINKNEFDILDYISHCVLDIVCETLIGVPSNEQINGKSIYVTAFSKMMRLTYERVMTVWMHPDIIYNFTKSAREQKECIKYLHKRTYDHVKQKRRLNYKKIKGKNGVLETTAPKRKAFLDLLIELSDKGILLEKEVYEEVDSMMLGANDTTSTATSFVIFMLANFPDIQEKCCQELLEIQSSKKNREWKLENEDLNRMKYLETVIKETLRLFPVAPFGMRNVADDLDIGGGYKLPKGSIAVLAFFKLHRSADFWDDPLSFNPDRFSAEQAIKRHPDAFFPFSSGLRQCPGSKYAMMSMKIIISNLLKNYVLIKDRHVDIEDIEIKPDIIIRTSNPLTIKIERRLY
ncbi:GSCOCT00009759001.2-RA-CDS [Cotesia congregata]|uniref:CYP4FP5 n=1 Tax=Cotesia congregata TaxID=51543 RepID=A0A8J2H9C6_COTCN|nr:GSCOCT00009759001.2-RA-CDS [Cotesia congregata]CAG5088508.1 CYP4FP5 [Cotesia congregata]